METKGSMTVVDLLLLMLLPMMRNWAQHTKLLVEKVV
jgi:hypothetical protein